MFEKRVVCPLSWLEYTSFVKQDSGRLKNKVMVLSELMAEKQASSVRDVFSELKHLALAG